MTTYLRNLHFKFDVAPSIMAEGDTCRVGSSVDFWNFSLGKQAFWQDWIISQLFTLLKSENFSLVIRHNRANFGTHLKNGFRVTSSERMFTFVLYMVRLAIKHPLFSVNSNLIYNFHQVWQRRIQAKSAMCRFLRFLTDKKVFFTKLNDITTFHTCLS